MHTSAHTSPLRFQACMSAVLLTGGEGATSQLRRINEMARAAGGEGAPRRGAAIDADDGDGDGLRRMVPLKAIRCRPHSNLPAEPRSPSAFTPYAHRYLDALQRRGHGGTSMAVHETSRQAGVEATERLKKAQKDAYELKVRKVQAASSAARARWQWALECVTTGQLYARSRELGALFDGVDASDPYAMLGSPDVPVWRLRALLLRHLKRVREHCVKRANSTPEMRLALRAAVHRSNAAAPVRLAARLQRPVGGAPLSLLQEFACSPQVAALGCANELRRLEGRRHTLEPSALTSVPGPRAQCPT